MRPPNRPARALAALCLAAVPLAACADDPAHRDVVAPIVLTEPATSPAGPGEDRTGTEPGARPVDPPAPEPAGPEPDSARRPDDDAPAPQGPVDDDSDDGDEVDDDTDDDDDDSDDDD